VAERVRTLRNYGSRVKYHYEKQGWNSRLDELQAALLRVKLSHLDEWNARRVAIARIYGERLAGAPGLVLPEILGWAEPVWHLFVIRHPQRDELQKRLVSAGIGTLIHYPIPPRRSPAYSSAVGVTEALQSAEIIAATALSLPIGPHLTIEQALVVVDAVQAACEALAR
jgi:dTDP-4-amino-4,6-dideoxygalactose transaminase